MFVNRAPSHVIKYGGSLEMNMDVIPCFEVCNGGINSVE